MNKKIQIIEKFGARVDKFLVREIFCNGEITRGEIIKNIKEGNILVNGKKSKPSYILKKNDELEIGMSLEKEEKLKSNKNIKLGIVFKNENIIAVDKPAGLAVHPTSLEKNDTLVNALIYNFPEIENVGDGSKGSQLRPGIVHRLDKDTSGILVVARNQKTFDELKNIFKERKIQKKYWALVYGSLEEKEGTIEKSLARAKNYKKQIVAHKKTQTKIRPAITSYKVIQEWQGFSLLEVSPKTGRTHQIRIHLSSLGNPVVGDYLYKNKSIKEKRLVSRQLLHAKSLEFWLFGKKFSFEAPISQDFTNFLNLLDAEAVKR